jgi:hypothetical protein
MHGFNNGTISVLLSSSGSALRARVRAADAGMVERTLAAVRDDAASTLDPLVANSAIRPANNGVEGEIEAADPVSRRGLRRLAKQTEHSMRRLGYLLERQVVANGGQVVSVYARCRRARA